MYGIFPYRTWCIRKEILWVGSDTNLCCVSVLCLEIAFFIIVWIWSGLIYKLMHRLSYLLIVMQMPQSTLGNASNVCLLRCTHLSYTRGRMKIHKHRSLGLRVCVCTCTGDIVQWSTLEHIARCPYHDYEVCPLSLCPPLPAGRQQRQQWRCWCRDQTIIRTNHSRIFSRLSAGKQDQKEANWADVKWCVLLWSVLFNALPCLPDPQVMHFIFTSLWSSGSITLISY